jgi:hypothetical protein
MPRWWGPRLKDSSAPLQLPDYIHSPAAAQRAAAHRLCASLHGGAGGVTDPGEANDYQLHTTILHLVPLF